MTANNMREIKPIELSVASQHDGIEIGKVERFDSLKAALKAAVEYEKDYGACSFFEVEVINTMTRTVEFYSKKIDG